MIETLVDSFDIWGTAQIQKSAGKKTGIDNISLHGINRLRELILELAVRGKLVEQNHDDEPAVELIKKISKEKKRLYSEGKIKKSKASIEISAEEKLFKLPKGWELVRLQELVYLLGDGIHGTPNYTYGTEYYFINGNNLNNGKIEIKADTKTVSAEEMMKHKKELTDNSVLVSINGTLGKVAFYNGEKIMLGKSACYFNLHEEINKHYIKLAIERPYFMEYALQKSTGTTIKNLGLKAMNEYPIPLPPVPEQHRIVAKVDELMALCDKLELQQMNHIETHLKLVEILLQTLTDATNADELKAAWQHLEPHFDILFTTEESIDLLKKTILQLAVMGKLTSSWRASHPALVSGSHSASALLKKIEAEKNKLIKEGKLKKQKPLPEITDDEKPFELPKGWEWNRLGDFCYVFSGASFKSEDFGEEEGVRVIKITNAGVGEFVKTDDYLPKEFLVTYQNFIVYENDLILALTRPYISSGLKISKCPPTYNESLLNQRVAAIRTFLKTDYLYQFMSSLIVLNIYQERFGKSGLQPNLKMSDVTNLLVPIPPENEQIRIVAKVNELMSLCDQLKERIIATQGLKVKLADAVVEGAVNAPQQRAYEITDTVNMAAERELSHKISK